MVKLQNKVLKVNKNACLSLCIVLFCFFFSCSETTVEKEQHVLVDSILNRAQDLINTGNKKTVLQYVDSSYYIHKVKSPIDLWKKYRFFSRFYLEYQSDVVKAKAYTDSMQVLSADLKRTHKKEYASTFFALGDVMLAEKRYNDAFQSYYNGRAYARKHLDACALAQFTYQLGMVSYSQVKMAEAIRYFKLALQENGKCTEKTGFEDKLLLPQKMLHMLGLSYGQLRADKSGDSSVYYFKQAIELIGQNQHLFPKYKTIIESARGEVYGDLGGTYMFLFKDDLAIYYLMKSVEINSRPNHNKFDVESSKIDLVYLYTRSGDFTKAASYISQLESDLKIIDIRKTDMIDLKLNLYDVQRGYYDKIHQIDSAYKYQQKFTVYLDSLKKAERQLREASIDDTFKFLILDRDNKLKGIYLIITLALIIISVFILFIIIRNRKRLASINETIVTQNLNLTHAMEALLQSQEENTRMMKTIAHDLRNPMSATISLVSLLLEAKNVDPDNKEMLELIKATNLGSLELTENLLSMNITYAELKMEQVDLHAILEYCVKMLSFKANEKRQQINLITSTITLKANREKLWRLFGNLIANAIKFTPPDSVINVSASYKDEQTVQIYVEDYGIGIPEELQTGIFDVFTDSKREGTSGESSFGLGLAISHQIVLAHGGKIWLESEENVGTTFYVELPVT